ncbi:hypothetical protein MHY87_03520 [Microvirga sp. ACRRW]|uniref:hypothetical protein n=1 Tax=Microvirga sp. ACRRW TaxID=2918205 RepID=UPI001EF60FA5|nr:hypothetical protein [Microvirga sp. ACRRW]MCG7391970.1 hypothetical protein [Microvirga sp. ACRRW]
MNPEELHKHLLTQSGMAAARSALVCRIPWLLHVTPLEAVDGIRRAGLMPMNPGGVVPGIVRDAIGAGAEKILCLRPSISKDIVIGKEPPFLKLAIPSIALPDRIGLDWSFPESWRLAESLYESNAISDPYSILVEVAVNLGSVVAYDSIPSGSIRVCPKSAPNSNLADWPPLDEAINSELALF